jgi:catechol 2,3-dioxygenase-like lactoylglutathione lyase family enzyme
MALDQAQHSGATAATRSAVRGVHHLALNTDDMKVTVDFYTEVLGMPLVHAMKVPPGTARGNPPFENIRHYFFDMGNDSVLGFFEIPKGAKTKIDRDGLAAMQHVSFATSAEGGQRFVERLQRHGVQFLGPLESAPGLRSIYFYDPNDIRLEISWRPIDHEDDIHVIDSVAQTREGALKELRTLDADPAWLERVTQTFLP